MRLAITRALRALAVLAASGAAIAGDEYDPDPNRLPGPKHMTPETCQKAPEVCKARKEHLRRQRQACIDNPGSCPDGPPKDPAAPSPS